MVADVDKWDHGRMLQEKVTSFHSPSARLFIVVCEG